MNSCCPARTLFRCFMNLYQQVRGAKAGVIHREGGGFGCFSSRRQIALRKEKPLEQLVDRYGSTSQSEGKESREMLKQRTKQKRQRGREREKLLARSSYLLSKLSSHRATPLASFSSSSVFSLFFPARKGQGVWQMEKGQRERELWPGE